MGPKVIRPDAAPPPSDDVVEFPGQPTMRAGSAVPPVRLVLPVNAGPRRGLLALAVVVFGLAGAMGLAVASVFVLSPPAVSSVWQIVLFIVVWVIAAVIGIA